MYSEENERLAEAAYNRWLTAHPNDPTWEQFPAKHVWRDLVHGYTRILDVRGIIPEVERCVVEALAIDGAAKLDAWQAANIAPAVTETPEPVAEPVKPKPAKAKK